MNEAISLTVLDPSYFGVRRAAGVCSQRAFVGVVLAVGDAIALLLANVTAYGFVSLVRNSGWFSVYLYADPSYLLDRLAAFSLIVAVALMLFRSRGHYRKRITFWDELHQTIKVLALMVVIDATVMYLTKLHYSRMWFLTTWLMAVVCVPATRHVVKRLLMRFDLWIIPIAVIGTGRNAHDVAYAFQDDPLLGYEVIAFIDLPSGPQNMQPSTKPQQFRIGQREISVLSSTADVNTILRTLGNPYFVVALEPEQLQRHEGVVRDLSRVQPEMGVVPSMRGVALVGADVMHFVTREVPLLRIQNNLAKPSHRLVKRLFDVSVAVILLVVLSPVFVVLARQLRRGGNSAFYGHARIGQDGREFVCHKFRTMQPNADRMLQELLERDENARLEWKQSHKLKNDPRVTPLGTFLRRTSLDELPQLWNVLRGEMSLVGPRPIVRAELPRYGDNADYYLAARPGVTGLWQIRGRSDTSFATRVYLDAWYVKNWNLWYDIVILLETIRVVLKRSGAY